MLYWLYDVHGVQLQRASDIKFEKLVASDIIWDEISWDEWRWEWEMNMSHEDGECE